MPDLGSTFAGHRIEGIAGRGGMGTVYRATHLALDHVVALKVISGELAADDGFRERFRSESRVAVSLRHPNVVPIHHAGEEDGLLFVTMDLIDGPDLRQLLHASGTLDPDRAARLIGQVAAALDVAHARGLVHRDIKPGNILVEQRPDGEHAYLTDFGLAKRFDQATDVSGLTGTGAFVGTLDYVAPEQIRGERVDARTDVYALGCVLYEVLAGRAPFAGREEKVAKIYAHLQDEPPWLPGDDEGPLDEVIGRALAKAPEDRFPSAGDLARAAEGAASGVISRVDERSVATGRAAPVTPSLEATQESPGPEPAKVAAPPATERVNTRSISRGDAPPRGLLIGGGLAALALVAVLLVVLGGTEETPAPDVTERFVTDSIPVAGFPVGLSVHDGQVTMATRDGRQLVSIDETSGGPVGEEIDLPHEGEDVAVIGDSAWVTLPQLDEVVEIDLESGDEIARVPVGDEPRGIVASTDAVWVAVNGSSAITKIAAEGGRKETIELGEAAPGDIAVGEGGLWVTDRTGDQVIRVDSAEETPFNVGDNPKGVVVVGEEVWVANSDSGDVTRIGVDGSDRETIDVDGAPRGIAEGFGYIWVANGDGNVNAIDPEDTADPVEIEVDGEPEEVAVGLERVWVTTGEGNELVSIDPDPTDETP